MTLRTNKKRDADANQGAATVRIKLGGDNSVCNLLQDHSRSGCSYLPIASRALIKVEQCDKVWCAREVIQTHKTRAGAEQTGRPSQSGT
jgi:hypothetical protein